MTYNRFLYNTALYNAGREEVGAIAKSIISAHTGPHIQAVVGGTSGVTFISDFNIVEGIIRPPPQSYKFPDLSAFLRAVRPGFDDLGARIHGFGFLDLPAAIYPVDKIPDLPATIYGLFQKDLGAIVTGTLAIADLPAFLNVPVAFLGGIVNSFRAPNLEARIVIEQPGNLGAIIWSPTDLGALLGAVSVADLGAVIDIVSVHDLPATMSGNPAGSFWAWIRSVISDTADLPAEAKPITSPDLPATIFPVPNDLGATITHNFASNLGATIGIPAFEPGIPFDLQGIINMIGAHNLKGIITAIPLGERDKFLGGKIGSVGNQPNLGATITPNTNLKDLGAILISNSGQYDLGARLRVAETFVTAVLTVSTMASRGLRATIGNPSCGGGTGNYNLTALATAQLKGDLGATIQSFIEHDLGATINSPNIIYAMDTIDVLFTPQTFRFNTRFLATDTIPISFVPFRGGNLGARIFGQLTGQDLPAELTVVFPQPRVTPKVRTITAADLRAGQELNITELRLSMEGSLLEYFYVNGTDQAFISDATENWVINISAFTEIADNLFGDFASSRVCRLGTTAGYSTLDEAVRACIDTVLGVNQQVNFGATITGTGQIDDFPATLNVLAFGVNIGDFNAIINQVYEDDFGATITGIP